MNIQNGSSTEKSGYPKARIKPVPRMLNWHSSDKIIHYADHETDAPPLDKAAQNNGMKNALVLPDVLKTGHLRQ